MRSLFFALLAISLPAKAEPAWVHRAVVTAASYPSHIDRLSHLSRAVRLNVPYHSSDHIPWGRDDYWATASETLNNPAGGDCEDIAELIRVLATRAGVPSSKLRLAYGLLTTVDLTTYTAPHVVLLYNSTPRQSYVVDTAGREVVSLSARRDFRLQTVLPVRQQSDTLRYVEHAYRDLLRKSTR